MGAAMMHTLDARILLRDGPHDVQSILKLQEAIYTDALSDKRENPCALFVEHPHVYVCPEDKMLDLRTLVRSRKSDGSLNLPAPLIGVKRTSGSITYHGPGQLVCYLVINLANEGFHPFMMSGLIDDVIIAALSRFSIRAQKKPAGYPTEASGVWVLHSDIHGDMYKKIASRGISINRGVTRFGFALNVNTDLSYFDYIYPCGLKDMRMTSMEQLSRTRFPVEDVALCLVEELREAIQKK